MDAGGVGNQTAGPLMERQLCSPTEAPLREFKTSREMRKEQAPSVKEKHRS